MPNYILRNVDDSLWERFKAKAAEDGRSLKGALLWLIQRYVDGKVK